MTRQQGGNPERAFSALTQIFSTFCKIIYTCVCLKYLMSPCFSFHIFNIAISCCFQDDTANREPEPGDLNRSDEGGGRLFPCTVL